MKTNKFPIVVDSFHYDLLSAEDKIQTSVNVAMKQVVPTDEDRQQETLAGNMFQLMVPFDVTMADEGFKISGQITQVVQLLDYFGQAQELDEKEIEKLSRPLIEYIETLTYQVTAVALNKGISLNFTSSAD